MPLNSGAGEDAWESLGQQRDPISHFKGNQPWIFIGRTDAEAEAPVLWSPDAKSLLSGKDCDAGKDWGQEESWTIEDEMFGWHHRLNGHGRHGVLRFMGSQSWTWLSDWTEVSELNWDNILKSRDITLSTKVCLVKAMVFPVAMYGCESWTLKKAEC